MPLTEHQDEHQPVTCCFSCLMNIKNFSGYL